MVRSWISRDESYVNTKTINKRLVDKEPLENPCAYLPNWCKDLSVMRTRKPVGADSRYVLCSSDHCHVSEEVLQGTDRWSDKLRVK